MKPIVPALIGVLCSTVALLGGGLWWAVVHSPGDDNPLGLLGALLALAGGAGAVLFFTVAVGLGRRGSLR